MKFLNQSLLSKLVGYFFLLSAFTVGLVAFTVNIRARDALQQSIFDRLRVATSLKAHQVNEWGEHQRRDTLTIAGDLTLRTQATVLLDPGATEAEKETARTAIARELAHIVALQPQIDRISLLTTAGMTVHSTDPAIVGTYQPLGNTTTYFDRIDSDYIVRPNFYTSLKTGRPMMTLAAPVLAGPPETAAVPGPDAIGSIQLLLRDLGFYDGPIDEFPGSETEAALRAAQAAYGLPETGAPDPATRERLAREASSPDPEDGDPRIAVVAVDLNLDGIDEIIRERSGLGNSGQTYLVGSLETHSAFISGEKMGEEQFARGVTSDAIAAALRGLDGEGRYRNYEGTPVIGIYTWLEDQNLALIAEMDQREAFAPADRLAKDILLLGLSSVTLLLIAVYLLTRKITRPILAITEAALQVSEGNLDCKAPVLTRDEIGILARAFNQMIRQLQQSNRQLAESNQHLEERVEAATAELQETLANLTSIIDHIADGLLVTDAEGKITRTNPALARLFQLGALDLRGQLCSRVFRSDVADLVLQSKARPKEVFQAEVSLAADRMGQAVATGVLKQAADSGGEEIFIGSVVLLRDITAEKEIDRMKTDFISTVSHELRTPLTSVLGFAKLIQKKLDDVIFPHVQTQDKKVQRAVKQVGGNVDIIVSEGMRLTTLINDVLDIAKMEAGKIEWHLEPLSVNTVVERAIAATSALFESKPIELVVRMEEHLPEIRGDRDKLIQVLLNLISNAVKFTETGSVTLRVKAADAQIQFAVSDTGSGIDEADLPKVFEKFKQVGNTLTNKPQGTGLGLPICKEIVEHHGGRIWAESRVGAGSTFFFTLPCPEPAIACREVKTLDLASLIEHLTAEPAVPSEPLGERKKRILIVDDDPSIRELLRQELDAEGYQIREAHDGREAIARVKQEKPDLVILDIIMPEISGLDVAAILKHDPDTQKIPILVLSADESLDRGYRVGVDKYLTKPVPEDVLFREVKTLLARGESPKRVLIVDRDTSTVEVLNEVLRAQGYLVTQSPDDDGEFLPHIRSLKPDLVIANAQFSEKYNLVKSLRFEKELANIFLFLLEEPRGENEG
ncbi:ATP-binding protein [Lyngbya sp. CCY1209]|uniref:ATP-binding protein n=1 Tax=Lyngbya sp. CCY1209 TaxID=2886103 RepID=UPI002D200735|nr:ATP-binding protein [Lyngbya sp. CCY1209]MEB3885144.1 response regulator [Lyngbya sp. CCY1209]